MLAAIDGKTIKWTPKLGHLFRNNNFNYQAGVVGCALSHYELWQHIASTDNELHLIVEDDAIFGENWIEKWNQNYFPELPANRFVAVFVALLSCQVFLRGICEIKPCQDCLPR